MGICECCQSANLASILLRDIREVIGGESFVPTSELVPRLIEHNPEQWSEANHYGRNLTPQRMGRVLARELGITSTRDHTDRRGYCASIFRSGQ